MVYDDGLEWAMKESEGQMFIGSTNVGKNSKKYPILYLLFPRYHPKKEPKLSCPIYHGYGPAH